MADTAELRRRMSALDASFLYIERPTALMHVAAVYTFGRPLAYEDLVDYVRSRLPLIPRYTQRVVPVPFHLAHPTWEPDPGFRAKRHMQHHRLSGRGDDTVLADLCGRLFAQPLDRGRPLWELHLIDNYGDGCALFAKTHHCMIDGASGVQLTNLIMDPSPHAPARETPRTRPPRARSLPSRTRQIADAVFDGLQTGLENGFRLVDALSRPGKAVDELRATLSSMSSVTSALADAAPATPFNGPVGKERSLGWATFSLNEVKAIRSRLGGTVNDVLLSVIAAALRFHLRELGIRTKRLDLKAMVPVNVRAAGEESQLGNRVSSMIAPLPVGIEDPVERLRAVSAAMDLLKRSPQSEELQRVLALSEFFPPALQVPFVRLQGLVQPVNTVCTNVPGPRETRYLLGEPVQAMIPFVPLAANIGLSFAMLSYADQITIGVTADAQRVADVSDVASKLATGFDELWQVTGLERVLQAGPVEPALKRRQRASSRARVSRASADVS